MTIEHRSNGRKVTQRLLNEFVESETIKSDAEIERRLRALRDPETGDPIKVTRFRVDGGTRFSVQGSLAAIGLARRMVKG